MGHWENIGLPEEFDGTVRLFPLPNLVLFPHVIQALHIFEPRYCEMLSEALESDHLIAMALLDSGWENHYHAQPRISDIVCIGRIISHSPTGDGRHNLFLAGIRRARIVEELTVDTNFRQAKVELIEDIPYEDPEAEEAASHELLDVFRAMIPKDAANSKTLSDLLSRQLPLGVLTDVIAYAVSLPISVKQYLLGEPSIEARFRVLIDNLTTLVDTHESPDSEPPVKSPRRGFPPPFSAN
jgi:ATP-dependent Lon protease